MLKIPFTGNSASALQLCRDKFQTKLLMRAAGINVPLGWLANDAADVPHTAGWPLIVKPMSEDGGIGIYRHSVVHTQADLAVQIKRIVNRYAAHAGGAILTAGNSMLRLSSGVVGSLAHLEICLRFVRRYAALVTPGEVATAA